MEGLAITGNTPFEKARHGRTKANLLLVTHIAVKDLIEQIDECDRMIKVWEDTFKKFSKGDATKEELEDTLSIATQALKDKKVFEAGLVQITIMAGEDLGLEA
tara:strand:+ start:117 stop:425 length:309 start_codon:yes stop_codon:yes gene_type:complete